ncbi:hypothetical protein JNUCC42_16425 [Brevibacterium sp. JNUCC-42]|nr:hypothetical protein JNUCC42_16425 [Brevibacterium sp. JNUCC-42]
MTRKFRVIHNRPPIISGQNGNLGIMEDPPSVEYSITDPEGDAFTITELLNGNILRKYNGVADRKETLTVPSQSWLTLQPDTTHTLTIQATDSQGMMSSRTYTLTRFVDKIIYDGLPTPFTTDIAAKRVLISPDWVIPPGATIKVETCNNAYDESPTWEDCTMVVRLGRGYLFTNETKTAAEWGIDIRFRIEKGEAVSPISFKGFGGAFD